MEKRCAWAENASPLEIQYHDEEWGVPVYDDQVLFEFLVLEGAQAGLSWSTILNKREGYRQAFDDFDVLKITKYDAIKIESLIQNSEIVRNKLKINSVVSNAKYFIEVQKEFGSFSEYLWGFVSSKPIVNHWRAHEEVPAQTELSMKISKDFKKRGFKFVGPTIIYAYMQAVGMVDDHTVSCFCCRQ
ncbi:DNA-3-methyladenine glycosylase I [Francisellaceae bacterium]|nr:DNA-3-methyladenine glycosylase I [Francisellaceae bacterium]